METSEIHEKEKNQRTRNRAWLAVYLVYLFIFTLIPFEFSFLHLKTQWALGFSEFVPSFFHLSVLDMINNILLFLPLGIMLNGLFHENAKKRPGSRLRKVVLSGVVLSLGLECVQLFL